MKVYKSINNNIVSAFDDSGREVVVIGKGIGYRAYRGTPIPLEKIDKVFVMSNRDNTERLKELLISLPTEYIELVSEIIEFAKQHLQKELNEGVYFTLADHIYFVVSRMEQGQVFQNILLTEVRRFYAQEFIVGLHAIRLMKERLGVDMPEDEAASIALHILHAEQDISIGDAFHVINLLERLLEIITDEMGYVIDTNDYHGERFLIHLKFLAQRIISGEFLLGDDEDFFELLAARYPKEKSCSEAIAAEVLKTHQHVLSKEEISSLTIHLKRIKMKVESEEFNSNE